MRGEQRQQITSCRAVVEQCKERRETCTTDEVIVVVLDKAKIANIYMALPPICFYFVDVML